jgi:hypothetical protein
LAGSTALVGSFGTAGVGPAGVKGRYLWLIERPTGVTAIAPIKYASGAARPADCPVKVVVGAIADVGAIIEREKPKASIALRDFLRSQLCPFFLIRAAAMWSNRLEPR